MSPVRAIVLTASLAVAGFAPGFGGLRLDAATGIAQAPAQKFYWHADPVGTDAQLITLNCHGCLAVEPDRDTPLISVLRDTLGTQNDADDRIAYVWLLTAPHRPVASKALSAVPFFYWHVGKESASLSQRDAKPLLNMTAPSSTVLPDFARRVVQWTALDPITTYVRATSRSYQSNTSDLERLQLQEAIAYLRMAPAVVSDSGLTEEERNTVIARLELRSSMLGGLATDSQARHFAANSDYEQNIVRSRNWDMLRLCAEKTGLYFEEVDLGGSSGQYAVLWYPLEGHQPNFGNSVKPVWKLLNIRDPWSDSRLQNWDGKAFNRQIDEYGHLLPASSNSPGKPVRLVPLGFYSLDYSRLPLLLVDFRDRLSIRRREMTQRTINELTSGVIGLSRITNWYYYVGAMGYNLVASRHGSALSLAERIDCYAAFRVHLGLEQDLNPDFDHELRSRANSMAVNPLAEGSHLDAQRATARYQMLASEADTQSQLLNRLERDRRAEQATFGQSLASDFGHGALHVATLGLYTQRVSESNLSIGLLQSQRKLQVGLETLDAALRNGTEPEVSTPASRLEAALVDVRDNRDAANTQLLRRHVDATLSRFEQLSKDPVLLSQCRTTVLAINSLDTIAESEETQKKEPHSVLTEGAVSLVEPVRFSGPARRLP